MTMHPNEPLPPMRFSVRALLIVVGLWSLLCAVAPRLESQFTDFRPGYLVYFGIVAILSAMAGYFGGHCCVRLGQSAISGRAAQIFAWIILLIAIGLCCYGIWALLRWTDDSLPFNYTNWPRPFPYPDELLERYGHWLDLRNPAPAGHIKIHGELYGVWEHLQRIIFGSIALAFWSFAVLTPRLPTWLRTLLIRKMKSCTSKTDN
jgi:hypothetical protein